jgi:hypothetical protein
LLWKGAAEVCSKYTHCELSTFLVGTGKFFSQSVAKIDKNWSFSWAQSEGLSVEKEI